MTLSWDEVWAWGQDERGWATLIAVLLLLAIAWSSAQLRKRRQTALLLTAVDDTTVGRCVPHVRSGAWGFAVAIEPPPDPFREFHVSFRALSPLDPLDWPALLIRHERPRLQLAGTLSGPPATEVLWVRGRPPLSVIGPLPGRGPWVHHRLELTRSEYALRGPNPGALRHAFSDVVARFYAGLVLVTVQREHAPELRVVFEGRLDPRDLSPLITSVRAMGRAALLD